MKRKTALITGVCGQDGSHLADFLHEKSYNVVGVMRRNATRDLGNAKHLDGVIDIVEGDIRRLVNAQADRGYSPT